MKKTTYWIECVETALDEAGMMATKPQIEAIASTVEGYHENYGMAHGHDCIPNPIKQDNERLRKELEIERAKVICPECKGVGVLRDSYGTRTSESICWKCNGDKRIKR